MILEMTFRISINHNIENYDYKWIKYMVISPVVFLETVK